MSHGRYELSERQWELVKKELPWPVVRADDKGRPSRSDRGMLNGIFWFLCSGSPWRDLPEKYGPWQTVYDRFRKGQQQVVYEGILHKLRLRLQQYGSLELSTWFVDATINKAHKSTAGAKKEAAGEPLSRCWEASRQRFTC
ncbi:MAG TPA: transposase [Pontibacter sp.]